MKTHIARPITQERASTICRELGLGITADLSHDHRTLHLRARRQVSSTDEIQAITAFWLVTDCQIHWHRWAS